MKYLVNKETKEHIVFHADVSVPYPHWSIVEADSEGWIPWNGGKCPLPDDAECVIETPFIKREMPKRKAEHWCWSHDTVSPDHRIVSYRPILAEKEEAVCEMQPASVLDRLRQATEAAESIPAILAEINALLPDGYCVTRCAGQTVKETDNANN